MPYVDGFVLPVPKHKLEAYRAMAQKAGEVWMEKGALEYRECAGDDLNVEFGLPFTKTAETKPDETVIFAWIIFKSKADRDRINKEVMEDPRLKDSMDPNDMPFDCKRMVYGGFETIVDL